MSSGLYRSGLFWMVPFAATVLLVPCYVASPLIEYWALSRLWKDIEKKKVFAATLRANTWSYVGLLVAGASRPESNLTRPRA